MDDGRLSRRAMMRLFSWSSLATLLGCTGGSGSGEGKRVLVLGAGVAGLSAAYELKKAGFEVTVLEGRERVGGRVYTLRDGFDEGGLAEIGAIRVGSTHVGVLEYADELGLELDQFGDGEPLYYLEGSRFKYEEGVPWPIADMRDDEKTRSLDDLTGEYVYGNIEEFGDPVDGVFPAGVEEKYDALTYAEYLQGRGASDGYLKVYAADQGVEIYTIGALAWMMAEAIDYDWVETYHIKGGNDGLPRRLAEEVGEDNVLLAHKVVKIDTSAGTEVTVTAEHDGAEVELTADYVVCALPFTLLRDVAVEPAFPDDKKKAIDEAYLINAGRGCFQVSERFWEAEGIGGRQIAKTDTPIERFWDLSTFQPTTTRGMIINYTQGAMADAYGDVAEGDRQEYLLGYTDQFFPELRDRTVAFKSHVWRDDPWARGAWTDFQPNQWWSFAVRGRPEGRIHFAGEHTSAWAGWMEGGVESGKRAAAEIVDRNVND
ncbi:MAG: FAD-dependent oxidoreductase [Nannocystaceae bacterium]